MLKEEFGKYLTRHPYRINSSQHFVNEMNKIDWKGGTYSLHKYDEESLYPNTNMMKAIGTLRKLIMEEGKHNQAEVNIICDILNLTLNTRYFSYKGKYYIQNKGVPMGGTISGLLAEIVLQEAENRVINSSIENLISFKRYVDDVLIVWDGEGLQEEEVVEETNTTNTGRELEAGQGIIRNLSQVTIDNLEEGLNSRIYMQQETGESFIDEERASIDTINNTQSQHTEGGRTIDQQILPKKRRKRKRKIWGKKKKERDTGNNRNRR